MNRPAPRPLDLRSVAFKDDPRPLWRTLHDGPPVVVTRQPLLGRVALAVHHDEALTVLRDDERFTVDARRVGHRSAAGLRWWVPGLFRPLADNMLTRDGEAHGALRERVETTFRRPRLEALQPRIDELAHAAVERLARSEDGDFVRHVARPVPQQVIGELLGLETAVAGPGSPLERALATLGSVHGPADLFRVLPAIGVVSRTLRGEIAGRRAAPRADMLSELVASDGAGRALDDDELLSMVFLLYAAGHETTTHLLSTSVLTLLREPGVRERPRDAPIDTGAVSELLRWLSPVQMGKPRFVTEDLRIGGVVLRTGNTIAPLVGAANADPRWIEDGLTLDLDRRPGRHLGFGAGAHVCLGLQLALREARTVLDALFARCPDIELAHPNSSPAWTRRLGLRVLTALPLTGL